MRPRTIMNPSVLRRLSAAAALVALVLALAVTTAVLLRSLIVLPLVVLGVVVTVLAGWTALVSRGRRRLVTAVVGLVALAGTLVLLGVETVAGTALVLGLVVASNAAARYALASEPGFVAPARTGHHVGPSEHGVLLLNPRSGGGKVTRFDLVAEAQRRGITPVLLEAGDDLRTLAERAAAAGASAIGMAGGDGSQAIVADVARTHDIAFVCVPAGTRNHFAADLGIDRDNVATALDAYGAAVERRIDLASVGGRIFVNNASLGAYAAIVQSEAYRDAKMSTAAALCRPRRACGAGVRPTLRRAGRAGAGLRRRTDGVEQPVRPADVVRGRGEAEAGRRRAGHRGRSGQAGTRRHHARRPARRGSRAAFPRHARVGRRDVPRRLGAAGNGRRRR